MTRRALKEKIPPIATGQIAASDAEQASLSPGHRNVPCLLLTRFESTVARLGELAELIGNSILLSRFLKSPSESCDLELRWFHSSEVLDRADIQRRSRQWHIQISMDKTKWRKRPLQRMDHKGVAAVNENRLTSNVHRSPRVHRKPQRENSSVSIARI